MELFATHPGPSGYFAVKPELDRHAVELSDLAVGILAAVGTHRCGDCGDAITLTAAAGVAEFAEYHRWLGRHERCDEIDRLRDEAQAIRDRHAVTGRVVL